MRASNVSRASFGADSCRESQTRYSCYFLRVETSSQASTETADAPTNCLPNEDDNVRLVAELSHPHPGDDRGPSRFHLTRRVPETPRGWLSYSARLLFPTNGRDDDNQRQVVGLEALCSRNAAGCCLGAPAACSTAFFSGSSVRVCNTGQKYCGSDLNSLASRIGTLLGSIDARSVDESVGETAQIPTSLMQGRSLHGRGPMVNRTM